MTRTVNIHEAKTHLSRLLAEEVAMGQEVVIARAGEPIAKLVPVSGARRELGFARDQVWWTDDFDETPDDIVKAFDGDSDVGGEREGT